MKRNVVYYGRDEPLPEPRILRAGALTLSCDNGELRNVRIGSAEVINRIYVAVRDRNWGTVAPGNIRERVDARDDSFRIEYEMENIEGDIDFTWTGTITGAEDGSIAFSMNGAARSSFLSNRIGFCVLHPRSCAGATCRVDHGDGNVIEGKFPRYILPDPPFTDIRAISHEFALGKRVKLQFSGDLFEMEDQRNWIDASFKTYCTPLRVPFPVRKQPGDRVRQSVSLTVQGVGDGFGRVAVPACANEPTRIAIGGVVGVFPKLGLEAASHGAKLNETELERLRALNLNHLRVEVRPREADVWTRFREVWDQAKLLTLPLEVALFVSEDAESELADFRDACREIDARVETLFVLPQAGDTTSTRWALRAREVFRDEAGAIRIGGGTGHYFAEFNRNRPDDPKALDIACFSVSPQFHAFDNASMVETLAAHADAIESARKILGDTPVAVTPVTLKKHRIPEATGPEDPTPPGQLPRQVDPRQLSLFGAGWTLGSIKYLAESGVASATVYQTTGWLGVMEREQGALLPDRFPSIAGAVFPMYHVFADLGELKDGEVLTSKSSNPQLVEVFAAAFEGGKVILVANLSAEEQPVVIEGISDHCRFRKLDETNAETAMTDALGWREKSWETIDARSGRLAITVRPYAVVRIDEVY